MQPDEHLLLAGASVRAAAFSALRAGLRPWCVDLFADADLKARCPVVALPPGRYPEGLVETFATAPLGPWLYTGALENRPGLVDRLRRGRPLWGNDGAVLRRVRSPFALAACLKAAGLPHPAVARGLSPVPCQGRWLAKPREGAGGRGIGFVIPGQAAFRRGRWYLQEHIEGEACAAVYLGDGEQAQLLGVTHQLVGVSWLHAAPFHYCGSIGPLALTAPLHEAFRLLGLILVEAFRLRGLFGVDCVVSGNLPYPVEVNPRYTASMEVVEHALGLPLLALHRQLFDPAALPGPRPVPGVLGKAVLFARRTLTFPAAGPWTASLRPPADPWGVPAFADIPHPGTPIAAGRPVLTCFARADSVAACRAALQTIAAELDHLLSA